MSPDDPALGAEITTLNVKSAIALPWPVVLPSGRQRVRGFAYSPHGAAVAASAGASADADYEGGVAVFVKGEKGLMVQASIGGQGFSFKPKE